jgi:hypothetical protein
MDRFPGGRAATERMKMQPEIMLFELCEMRRVPLFSRVIYPICLSFARLMFLGLWSPNLSTAESVNFALRDKLKF